jgi:hypothetical protein
MTKISKVKLEIETLTNEWKHISERKRGKDLDTEKFVAIEILVRIEHDSEADAIGSRSYSLRRGRRS